MVTEGMLKQIQQKTKDVSQILVGLLCDPRIFGVALWQWNRPVSSSLDSLRQDGKFKDNVVNLAAAQDFFSNLRAGEGTW